MTEGKRSFWVRFSQWSLCMTQHVNICQWNRSDCVLICMFLYEVAMKLLNTNHKQTTIFTQPPSADSFFSSWKSRIRTHENLRFPCLWQCKFGWTVDSSYFINRNWFARVMEWKRWQNVSPILHPRRPKKMHALCWKHSPRVIRDMKCKFTRFVSLYVWRDLFFFLGKFIRFVSIHVFFS